MVGFPDWPYAGKRVVVMTHQALTPRRAETFTSASPQALLAQLTREGSRRIYVDGANVIQQFLAAGLIDDLTITVVPIVLGGGIRLFAGGEGERSFVLESARSWQNGLAQLRYRAVTPP